MLTAKEFVEFMEGASAKAYIHHEGGKTEVRGEALYLGFFLTNLLKDVIEDAKPELKLVLKTYVVQEFAENVEADE